MYHNDYTVLVKEYLNRYNEFKQYVANVEAEIEDYKEMLKLSAVPKVPSLSPAGGCGVGMGPARRNGRILSRRTWKSVSKTAIRTFWKYCRRSASWTDPWMR